MSDTNRYLWDPSSPPDPGIEALEQTLQPYRQQLPPLDLSPARPGAVRRRWPWLATAAALLVVAGGSLYWSLVRPAPWSIQAVAGTPTLASRALRSSDRLGVGQSLETDRRSRAQLAVGTAGTAELDPGSRLDLVRADGVEHRLALRYGTLHVNVWAAPRFFNVEVPWAVAVDLGCIYSLRVEERGSGLLAVRHGEVELVSNGHRTLVPAGNAAAVLPVSGPGLPYPLVSSEAFRTAVRSIDAGTSIPEALEVLLAEAGQPETITLWHLFPRVDAHLRERLYERLATLSPPPGGVSRPGIVGLDAPMLERWKDQLRPMWTATPASAWRRLLVHLRLVKPAVRLGPDWYR